MKLLKKILIGIALFVLAELLIYLIGTGFIRNRFVSINEYSVSADGSEMTVKVAVPASIGYIRKIKTVKRGAELCLDCYSAFGGINGSIGAHNTYIIPLDDDTKVIALYRGDKGYEYVLYRDQDGTWKKVQ